MKLINTLTHNVFNQSVLFFLFKIKNSMNTHLYTDKELVTTNCPSLIHIKNKINLK
jgi:hypothetical protein